MDSFSFTNLQAEKANAILKHRKLRRLANVLRFVEVCAVLAIVSRFSLQLPLAVKNSNNYFKDMSCFMKSPSFVFLIGNIIIVVLFAQSGHFSAQGSARNTSKPDMYQEFHQNNTKSQRIEEHQKNPEKQNIETRDSIENQKVVGQANNKCPEAKSVTRNDDIINSRRINVNMAKYPENNGICSGTKKHRIGGSMKQSMKTGDSIENQKVNEDHNKYPEKKSVTRNEDIINSRRINGNMAKYPENKGIYSSIKKDRIVGGKKQSMKTGDVVDSGLNLEVKDYRRCQTQVLSREHNEKQPCSVLRRCGTEIGREIMETCPSEDVAEISYAADDMSNEEFRQTVEAFIAREQRLRREEDNSLV